VNSPIESHLPSIRRLLQLAAYDTTRSPASARENLRAALLETARAMGLAEDVVDQIDGVIEGADDHFAATQDGRVRTVYPDAQRDRAALLERLVADEETRTSGERDLRGAP
jgi:hypothetical protein